MIPCSPPMMLVSIVGQAIFHTASRSGPSTIERSNRLAGAATGGAAAAAGCVGLPATAGAGAIGAALERSGIDRGRLRCALLGPERDHGVHARRPPGRDGAG